MKESEIVSKDKERHIDIDKGEGFKSVVGIGIAFLWIRNNLSKL